MVFAAQGAHQGRAAFPALLAGLLILALTGVNQLRSRPTFERAVALEGAWTVLAPWFLRFAANDAATWAQVTAGAVAMAAVTCLRIARAS